MDKETILQEINNLKQAVENKDVPTLIQHIEKFGVDIRFNSPLTNYVKEILIEAIEEKVYENKGKLCIKRMNVYHEEITDIYIVENGKLMRNGIEAKWSSIGKLYTAYNQIKNK